MTATAVVFPGQGTQSPGMGRPWRDHPAWSVVERAEAALDAPLATLLLDASAEDLARTREAQLAVLITSLMAWEAIRDAMDAPVAFAGHSLGQVTALIASGALAVDDGIRFASARATATQDAADRHPGRMTALVGAPLELAEAACSAVPDACWVANDNAPGQVVVAGTPEGVEAAILRAQELGVRRVLPLAVGGAFHTPLMRDATEELDVALDEVPFRAPEAPVISNLDAQAHDDADWSDSSARHVSTPVRWRESMTTLSELGIDRLVEVGHGTMIAALAKRTIPDVPVLSLAIPDQIDELRP